MRRLIHRPRTIRKLHLVATLEAQTNLKDEFRILRILIEQVRSRCSCSLAVMEDRLET